MLAMLIIVGLAGYYGSRRSAMRIAMLKMMLCVMYVLAYVFGMAAILPLWRFSTIAFVVPIFVLVGVVLAYSYKLTSDPDIPFDATPDSCWRLSSIYYNPADPALFVQKRIGHWVHVEFRAIDVLACDGGDPGADSRGDFPVAVRASRCRPAISGDTRKR